MGKIDQNKKQKRTSLLDTAFSLFTSRGIHNTSISDIVESAGVAKGTFYLYFKDKYDIKNKLIAHKAGEVFRTADEAMRKEDFSAFGNRTVCEEKVIFLIDNIISQFAADKTLLRFISKKLDWGMLKKVMTGTGSDGVDGYDIYGAVFGTGSDRYDNPEIMVYMIIELVSSICYSAIIMEEPAPIEELKPYIFRTVRQIMQSHLIKNEQCREQKFIAVELAPPANADDEKLMDAAHFLKGLGVDVLTFPDSPSGRTRVDPVLMAGKVRRETGMRVMPHICCRDKNAIAVRSTFLGAHINDIHNFLIVTGDPVPESVRQTTKSVFNFDSVGLMNIARSMNKENFQDAPLTYGGAINQGRKNLDVEIARVRKKMEAGASFFLTQPIFTEEAAGRVRDIKRRTGACILCGIMPFISRRNALFMKNEIAGVEVPDEIIDRYPENAAREEGEEIGIAIAAEIIAKTQDFADGYYFSFPFLRVHMLKQILQKL